MKNNTSLSILQRKELYDILYDREKGKCYYCECFVNTSARKFLMPKNACYDKLEAVKQKAGTIDHIIPRSRNGSDDANNCVLACAGCNFERNDMPAIDFLYDKRNRLT